MQLHRFKDIRENYLAKVQELLAQWMSAWEKSIEMMTMFEIKQTFGQMEKTLHSLITKFLRHQVTLTEIAKPSPEKFVEIQKDDLSDSLLGLSSRRTRKGSCNKRIPGRSLKVLETWFSHNQDDPYPSLDEKRLLSASTGLSLKQITNWFINRRCKLSMSKYRKKRLVRSKGSNSSEC